MASAAQSPSPRSTPTTTPSPDAISFTLRGEHIALDAMLKATGIAGSGGHAKLMITRGEVRVNGAAELRRACKLRPGQTVEAAGQRVQLLAGELPTVSPPQSPPP